MKKYVLIFMLVCTIFLSGCFGKLTSYSEISFNQLEKMIDSKKSFVLLIGSSDCSHCELYKSTIEKVIKDYQVKVYYIDITKLDDSEDSKLKNIVSYSGTPTVAFIKKGREGDGKTSSQYKRIVGNKTYSYTVKKFKSNGFIKE